VHLVGFIIKKIVTMHGHVNVKYDSVFEIRHSFMRVSRFYSVTDIQVTNLNRAAGSIAVLTSAFSQIINS